MTPMKIPEGPSSALEVGRRRRTRGRFLDNDEKFEICDDWVASSQPHRDLGRLWTGHTEFYCSWYSHKEKEAKKRDTAKNQALHKTMQDVSSGIDVAEIYSPPRVVPEADDAERDLAQYQRVREIGTPDRRTAAVLANL